jgi:hypothetical protein
MKPLKIRFHNNLKTHLIHLQNNVYIHRSDPNYFKKVNTYLSGSRATASHFRLGRLFELHGTASKAFFHYKEVLRNYPSPYHAAADQSIHQLKEQGYQDTSPSGGEADTVLSPLVVKMMKVFIVLLALLNITIYSAYWLL